MTALIHKPYWKGYKAGYHPYYATAVNPHQEGTAEHAEWARGYQFGVMQFNGKSRDE